MTLLPRIGVGVVVVRDGDILLVRRSTDPGRGKWAVPGGRVEAGERLRAAAIREAREETGLEVAVGAVAWEGEVDIPGPPGPFRYAIVDFEATITGGVLAAGSDAEDAQWVPLSVAGTFDVVPSMRGLLERFG